MLFNKNLSNTSRLQAFIIHFSISLIIFFILLYFILIQWYPQPLFSTDGGSWRVIRIIAGVDLVLGPLLTLIVFKPGKAGLKFDLTMIAIVQVLALSWGVWNSYNERPIALIFTLDYFTPVPAYQLSEIGITSNELKKYGTNNPVMIYSNIPKEKVSITTAKSLKTGTPLYLFPEYYENLTKEHHKVLRESSMGLENYVEDKPELKKLFLEAVSKKPVKKNISYLALHSREKWVTAIFDLDSMKIIDTIDIEPSAYTHAKEIKVIDKEGKVRTIKPVKAK